MIREIVLICDVILRPVTGPAGECIYLNIKPAKKVHPKKIVLVRNLYYLSESIGVNGCNVAGDTGLNHKKTIQAP